MLKKYLPVGIGATWVPGTGSVGGGGGGLPTGRVYVDELAVGSSGAGMEPGDG